MNHMLRSTTFTAGLAFFAMLFGAGNLMFPLKAGLLGGDHFVISMLGFFITAIGIPLLGLIGIILFDGDYHSFFCRVGRIPGNLLILMCMLIIGPVIAMPRLITASFLMLQPYLPINLPVFSALFLLITFIGAVRENKIIDLIGRYVTPIFLVLLSYTIMRGVYQPGNMAQSDLSSFQAFVTNLSFGLSTLDLFGTIFLGAIIISILKQNLKREAYVRVHTLALMAFYAGLVGACLLIFMYLGLGALGWLQGGGYEQVSSGVLFSSITLTLLGDSGGVYILGAMLLLACFSTSIALAAVVSEYFQRDICNNKMKYIPALSMVCLLTFIFSLFGFDWILDASVLLVEAIGLPIVITLTFANIAYKLFNFRPVKIPVALVAIYMTVLFIKDFF